MKDKIFDQSSITLTCLDAFFKYV